MPSVLKETRHLVLAYNILYEQAVKALPSGIHTVCMHNIRVFPIKSISIAPPPHTSLCCYNMILKSALNCLSTLNLLLFLSHLSSVRWSHSMVGFLLGPAQTERAAQPVSAIFRAQIGGCAAGTGGRSAGRRIAGKKIVTHCIVK